VDSSTSHSKPVITGFGVISATGPSAKETLDAFYQGRRQGAKAKWVRSCLEQPVFEITDLPHPENNTMRTLQLAKQAVCEALETAKLTAPLSGKRVGVCLGTTVACQLNDVEFLTAFRETGDAPMEPVDRYLSGNLAEAVAREIGATGPCTTVTNACASGTDAIGVACSWLNAGICDIVLAGGADELNRVPMAGFNALCILSSDLCRPFDQHRTGLNLGEGAGILVLETKESATQREVETDLYLAGYGTACDAYHLTAPRPDGEFLKTAIRTALADAAITPADIAFINAHGTATPDNDHVEGQTIAELFGTEIPMLSTKGYTGHTLGAAGGIEAVFTALALREQWIPACAGFSEKDENIPITPVTTRTNINGSFALSTSLAFGGGNSALVIARRTP